MNARHVSRELALLSLPQLWVSDGQVDVPDLVEQAVRFLASEARDALKRAAELLHQGEDKLLEARLREQLDTARELVSDSCSNAERAMNLIEQALDWPVMGALANQEDVRKYAIHLAKLVQAHKQQIDDLLNREMTGWTVDRLHSLDRDILRLAIAELMYEGSVPVEVGIDEAVELAKRFGSEDSSGFVNGVLKRLLPTIDKARKEAVGGSD